MLRRCWCRGSRLDALAFLALSYCTFRNKTTLGPGHEGRLSRGYPPDNWPSFNTCYHDFAQSKADESWPFSDMENTHHNGDWGLAIPQGLDGCPRQPQGHAAKSPSHRLHTSFHRHLLFHSLAELRIQRRHHPSPVSAQAEIWRPAICWSVNRDGQRR